VFLNDYLIMDMLAKMTSSSNLNHGLEIVQLIYCSHVRNVEDNRAIEQDINNIIIQSKTCNLLYDITSGMLSDKVFYAHIIEGPPSFVKQLYSNIAYDARHNNIIVLQYIVINVRLFDLWPMVYVEVDEIPYADKLDIQSTPAELRKARIAILKSFRPIFLQ